jgi:hypothetical protein
MYSIILKRDLVANVLALGLYANLFSFYSKSYFWSKIGAIGRKITVNLETFRSWMHTAKIYIYKADAVSPVDLFWGQAWVSSSEDALWLYNSFIHLFTFIYRPYCRVFLR